jgi:hypothetical protein
MAGAFKKKQEECNAEDRAKDKVIDHQQRGKQNAKD